MRTVSKHAFFLVRKSFNFELERLHVAARFRRSVVFMGGLFGLQACGIGITSADLSAVSGVYRLQTVDGQALPFPLAAGACPNAITEGSMGLSPRISNRRPLYSVNAYASLTCQPSQSPSGEGNPLHDFGEWSFDDPNVHFSSEEGFGDYTVRSEQPDQSKPVEVVLRLRLGGHEYAFNRYDAQPR